MGFVLAFLVALALGSPSFDIRLECGDDCDAVAVIEGEKGNHGTFHALRNGLLVLATPPETGLYWIHFFSSTHSFPLVQLVVRSDVRVALNVNGDELAQDAEGCFLLASLGKPVFFEQRPVFSFTGLLSSPMVIMGGVTVGMMLIIQFLLKGMGSVDEIRKVLRGELEEEAEKKTQSRKKTTKIKKA
jgi:hypothetical protein